MIKRILIFLLFVVIGLLKAGAQEGLNISPLFDGRFNNNSNAIEVLVKGKKLAKYNLTLFRSLTLKNSPDQYRLIENMVMADGAKAVNKETGKVGSRLFYGFFQLPSKDDKNRYLFYRNNSLSRYKTDEITLVYMEGNTTIDELKNMFK